MKPSAKTETRDHLLLGGILCLALVLRLYKIGQANLWWDEALAVWAVRKGLVGATAWTAGDVHPPLYFWCLWAWRQLFGESALALRSLSALLGTATIWAAYTLGRQVTGRQVTGREATGRRVGLWAAALTAVAPFAIWWSQELRMYVLAGLLCTVALRYTLQWLQSVQDDTRPPALSALAWSALAWLAALYTIFLSGAALLAANLVVLLAWLAGGPRRQFKMALRWAVAQLGILALLTPWLLYSWNRMPTWSVSAPVSPWFVARLYATLLTTGVSENIGHAAPAVLATLAVLALGLAFLLRRRDRARQETWGAIALLSAIIVPGLFVYVSTLPRGLFYTPHVEARYFLPFAPAFWTLLAWAASELGRRRRWIGHALASGLVLLSATFLPAYYGSRLLRDDVESMSRAIISQSRPGDVVLLDSGSRYPVFLYDYERLAPGATRPPVETISHTEEPLDAALVQDWLDALLTTDSRVWLAEVDVHLTDPDRLLRGALDERLPLTASWGFGANALLLFAADGQPPRAVNAGYRPEYAVDVALGGGQLVGWDLPESRYVGGDTAHLALFWETAPREPVWLHLTSQDWLTLLHRRLPTIDDAAALAQNVPLQAGLPPAKYELHLESASGEDLPLGRLQLVGERATQLQPGSPVGATCGPLLLKAYRVQPADEVAPGATVTVDLFWLAQEAPARDYTVFVHALGSAFNPATNGPVWGQHDAPPLDGQWPTSAWQPGDMLLDRHLLVLAEDTTPGSYQLEVGLYDSQSGERSTCLDSQGQAVGGQLLLPGFAVK